MELKSHVRDTVMVWYGMVNVDLYSAIITKVSNALDTLVSGEKPGFQTWVITIAIPIATCDTVVKGHLLNYPVNGNIK